MQNLHAVLATSVLYFMAIAGLWGLASALTRRGVTSTYWGILAVGELLILLQALLGVLLWVSGARPGRETIHALYGAVAVIGLPGLVGFLRGRDDRIAAMLYGLLCLLLAAISVRAAITGVSS